MPLTLGCVATPRAQSPTSDGNWEAAFWEFIDQQAMDAHGDDWKECDAFESRTPCASRTQHVSKLVNAVAPAAPTTPTTRVQRRRRQFAVMRIAPLQQTVLGQSILHLVTYSWILLPNGLAVLQFSPKESRWRCNMMAMYINALQCGAHAHRSVRLSLLAIERLDLLNARFARDGAPTILPSVKSSHGLRGTGLDKLFFLKDNYDPTARCAPRAPRRIES